MHLKKVFALLFVSFLLFEGIAQTVEPLKGFASFYGNALHGRRTSDGSKYDKDSLTCAHRTLPFGTLLKVRNTSNGKEVVVKVTDRGPHTRGRVVDLSMAAAKELNMVGSGLAKVEVEQITAEEAQIFALQKRANSNITDLQFYDPRTGNFMAADTWVKQEAERKEKARIAEMRKKQLAQAERLKTAKPNFKILRNQLTALNKNLNKKDVQ